jgi:hypothetical protein
MDETELSARGDPEGQAGGSASIATPEVEEETVLGADPDDVEGRLHPDNVETPLDDVDAPPPTGEEDEDDEDLSEEELAGLVADENPDEVDEPFDEDDVLTG